MRFFLTVFQFFFGSVTDNVLQNRFDRVEEKMGRGQGQSGKIEGFQTFQTLLILLSTSLLCFCLLRNPEYH